MDFIFQKFKELYTPTQNLSIDEAMCPWKGRLVFRVYMRDKPTKWGIKLYKLCESDSGYIWNFEVFCHQPAISNKPVDVCMRLAHPLLGKGYRVYVNNYYCCPELGRSLLEAGTHMCGTVRSNRVGMPKDLMSAPLQRGDMDYRRKGKMVAVRWKDKRDVNFLSTIHKPQMVEVVSGSRQERKRKPTATVDYINHMAGVDHSDQLISYLPLHRKTVKWWKKLVLHLLTVVMIQAHILHNKVKRQRRQKAWKLDSFVKAVCRELAQDALVQTAEEEGSQGGPGPAAVVTLDRLKTGHHFPVPLPLMPSGRKLYRSCHVCYARAIKAGMSAQDRRNKKQGPTDMMCEQCKVALCLGCWKAFHTQKEYV